MGNKKLVFYYLTFNVIWFLFVSVLENASLQHTKLHYIIYILITSGFFAYLLKKQGKCEELYKEEQTMGTLINAMADFISFKDGEGRWIQSNEFGLHLFQLENIDYKGKRDSELSLYSPFYQKAFQHCELSDEKTWKARKITRSEEVIPLPDGSTKTLDTIKVPLFNDDGSRKALVVIGRDITERKIAEKRLEQSEQRYKSLFKYNPDVVYMVDLHGIVTNLNPHFEVITGYKPEEFIGKSILRVIEPSYRNDAIKVFKNVIEREAGTTNHELVLLHKAGAKSILNCTTVPMVIDDQIVGVIGYGQNVTHLKETEERLRRTEMLSTIGELAAGVAHEIRNPLTALRGFVQLLRRSDKEVTQYYDIMLDELDRINHIVSELLVLSKPQKLTFGKGNVQTLLKDVITLLQTQANFHGVEIALQMDKDIPPIDCDGNQLKQLFINLIKNSFEANASKVKVELKRDNDHVSIRVLDNGCGIPEERLHHLGEPFYSYKDKGTGLGLTVSYRIVELHKGKIHFDSKVKEGTIVEVILPISSQDINKGAGDLPVIPSDKSDTL